MAKSEMYKSLLALSVGDATGENELKILPQSEYKAGNVKDQRASIMDDVTGYWPWTDDTAMAIGVFRVLSKYGIIKQEELAREFAANAKADPQRGYIDSKRVGTRIDFDLVLNGGTTKVKLENVEAFARDKKGNLFSRPLQWENPLQYNYTFHQHQTMTFHTCIYIDDVPPEELDVDCLLVEATDTTGEKHLITPEPK